MLFALALVLASPADWVPARWPWTEVETIELVRGSAVNCLLIPWDDSRAAELAAFAAAATEQGVAPLAVFTPAQPVVEIASRAVRGHFRGIVLEGDFPERTADRVRDALAGTQAIVIELTARSRMKLGGGAPIIGTYQGVWAGIQVLDDGHAKSGPTGSPWIDTNSGFIRAARARGDAALWLGNLPPPKTIIKPERYLQVLSDAAMVGGRWIVALDADFSARLRGREDKALGDWRRILSYLKFYEDRKDFRALQPFGKLALVQDDNAGALLSGGILDMIATKHTPVRAVPRPRLKSNALAGATLAVNVDPEALTPEQREVLRDFTRAGGTLLTAPPGWKGSSVEASTITLEKAELERLDSIWREVNSMIGRRNLGARLFNVSSMLSSLSSTPDARQIVVQLVNYSDYPVDSVAVHFLGQFKRARLYTPEGAGKNLEVYPLEEGVGVDVERIAVAATLVIE